MLTYDTNRAIPRSLEAWVGCDSDGDSESIFRNSTFYRDSAADFLAILGPRFWEGGRFFAYSWSFFFAYS